MSPLHRIDVPFKKATFAMGCFWGPDSLFGATKGVLRTRVGFTAGTFKNPTYKNLGDNTEAIEIDFDPKEINFSQLLGMFWDNHDPTQRCTKQYTSIILYHDESQKEEAQKSMAEREAKSKAKFVTTVVPANQFYNAEDYHQKYRLQQYPALMSALGLKCDTEQLTSSHVAARVNGYVVGSGGVKQFDEEVKKLGLDEKTAEIVRKLVTKYEGHGLFC